MVRLPPSRPRRRSDLAAAPLAGPRETSPGTRGGLRAPSRDPGHGDRSLLPAPRDAHGRSRTGERLRQHRAALDPPVRHRVRAEAGPRAPRGGSSRLHRDGGRRVRRRRRSRIRFARGSTPPPRRRGAVGAHVATRPPDLPPRSTSKR